MPYIIEENGIIEAASLDFMELSGFSKEEIINNSLVILWKDLLRVSLNPNTIIGQQETFIFTKSLEARLVYIKKYFLNASNTTIYTFEEKPELRLSSKFSYIDYLFTRGITGVAIYSAPDLILLKANQIYLNFLDKPFNEAKNSIGKDVYSIISGFKGSDVEKSWSNIFVTGEVFDIKEMPYIGYERGITYWNTTLVPIYEDGVMKYIIQTADEVTESVLNKKKLEEQARVIKQQKDELETIIHSMSDAVYIINSDGSIFLMNEESKRRFSDEYPTVFSEACKYTKYFFLDGSEIPSEQLPFHRALKGETVKNLKMIVRQQDKEYITQITAKPIFDETGKVSRAVVCSHDITDLVLKERILNEQKEELEVIVEGMSDALIITDSTGNILKINNEAKRQYYKIYETSGLGDTLKTTKYMDMYRIEIPRDEMPGFRALRGEKTKNRKLIMQRPDKEFIIDVNCTPIHDDKGDIKMVIACSRDVTDTVLNEQTVKLQQELLLKSEIEKREALEASIKLKDEFLYLITHEFKTPMAIVNSALQAINLICKADVTERVDKYLGIIKKNTNRQLRLVNNLLDITRMNSGAIRLNNCCFDIVFVTKSIVSSVELYSKQKGVNLAFESTIEKKEIYMDEEKFERILLNLLSNALKFTPKGKNINVHLSLKLHDNRKMISIRVVDEGIGIPKDKQSVIFHRFGQADTSLSRQAEGTGLGLHLVKLLINALNGDIILESEEGHGSSFTVLLPAIKPSAADEVAASQISNAFLNDDNRIIQATSIEFSDIYFE